MGYISTFVSMAKPNDGFESIHSSTNKKPKPKNWFRFSVAERMGYISTNVTMAEPNDGFETTILQNKKHPKGCFLLWRKEWDSNPCAEKSTTAFRVRLVMTTSISFRLYIKFWGYERGNAVPALLLRQGYEGLTPEFGSCRPVRYLSVIY